MPFIELQTTSVLNSHTRAGRRFLLFVYTLIYSSLLCVSINFWWKPSCGRYLWYAMPPHIYTYKDESWRTLCSLNLNCIVDWVRLRRISLAFGPFLVLRRKPSDRQFEWEESWRLCVLFICIVDWVRLRKDIVGILFRCCLLLFGFWEETNLFENKGRYTFKLKKCQNNN